MIGGTADDYGRAVLRGGLIGEGKRDEDDLPELIAGHSRRRRDYPKHGRRRVPRLG